MNSQAASRDAARSVARKEIVQLAKNVARNAGYFVFPCASDKKPAISEKEGGHGFHDASRDPETISRLFSHPRAALIGIATGAVSGIDVLDIDCGDWPDNANPKIIAKHESARGWLHAKAKCLTSTRVYQTASGGLHLYYKHHPSSRTTQGVIAQGIDTRADGGYALFWFADCYDCLDNSPPAEWPAWLLEALAPKPQPAPVDRVSQRRDTSPNVEQVIRRALERVGTAQEGMKHEAVRKTARLLGGVQARAGFSDAEAISWIKGTLPSTVKDWRNVERTAEWGLEHGRAEPIALRGDQ